MYDWEDTWERCGRLVWATAYRILKNHDHALDCTQEVFLEAFRRSQDEPVREWPGYLRWLAVRRALDHLRKLQRSAAHITNDGDVNLCMAASDPFEEAQFRELMDRVRIEMARLPERQAEAFWLCCVEEMSYSEAAAQMGTDVNMVGVLVHRARSRLRTLLADLKPARAED